MMAKFKTSNWDRMRLEDCIMAAVVTAVMMIAMCVCGILLTGCKSTEKTESNSITDRQVKTEVQADSMARKAEASWSMEDVTRWWGEMMETRTREKLSAPDSNGVQYVTEREVTQRSGKNGGEKDSKADGAQQEVESKTEHTERADSAIHENKQEKTKERKSDGWTWMWFGCAGVWMIVALTVMALEAWKNRRNGASFEG